MSDFAHLHLHTHHSQLDGYGTSEQFAKRAKVLRQRYLAITNHGVADGFLDFSKSCKDNGIKPIFGCELYIVPDINKKTKEEKRFHILALIKNNLGLHNLNKMLSIANLEGFYKRPRIDPEILREHRDGLVFSSACALSFINMEGGIDLMNDLKSTNEFYLEIMPHNYEMQKKINVQKYELHKKYKIPLLATNDCHYPLKGDSKVQEVLLAIQRKAKWNDPNRWKFGFDGLHLRSSKEMKLCFKKQGTIPSKAYLEAIENTIQVSELCSNFDIPRCEISLPKIPQYADRDEDEVLEELIENGYKEKIGKEDPIYRERIEKELKIIRDFRFQRYFLIVYEILDWCKNNDIFTGIGRGSVSGSLIAYLLNITIVDPIKYNLPVERFLNPGRTDSLPDIDMDFPDNKRNLVKQHIIDLYGEYNVAAISTFLTIKGRGALRDVARVFDVPLNEVDIASKSIPSNASIQEALDSRIEPIINFRNKYPEVVDIAIKLDGQIRGSSKHPAGMCISSDDLRFSERCYLCNRNGELTCNLDMNETEYRGLIKFDILGLSALTILDNTRKLVKSTYGEDVDFDKIPLDDEFSKKIYKEISKGNNVGIFQFGASTTSNLCVEIGISNFYELVVANALSRPGTLQSGLATSYIRRKFGKENIDYIHPKLKKYTKDTYGIIVFQEQVMWLMNKLAGLDWSICDIIRKVIGKSKGTEEFNKYKGIFVDGCKKQKTLTPKEADHVWEQLSSFGKYSFNQAHATSYSLIAFFGAYLKQKYPKEYMCSLLTYEGGNKEEYIREAKRLGLEIVLPKRGFSDPIVWKSSKDSNKIYCPFIEIKGVGEARAEKLAKKRSKEFSFFDLESEKKDKFDIVVDKIDKIDSLPDEEIKELQKFFDFPITSNREYFLSLGLGDYSNDDIINCNLEGFDDSLIEIRKCVKIIDDCHDCSLRQYCKSPVSSSFGKYNIMIVGEAPGQDEDRECVGFIGRSGKILWNELSKYDLNRNMFHVTNVVKCYPGNIIKTPTPDHINICSKYIISEIEELRPIIILALGKTALKFFKNKAGIMDISGKVEWNNVFKCWIFYCIHPAAVLYNPNNKILFENSINSFVSKLKMIGGSYLSKVKNKIKKQSCPYGADFGLDNNKFEQCGDCKLWYNCARFTSNSDWKYFCHGV